MFLWYIIAFVTKNISIHYNKNPFSFDIQSTEAKQRVLDTKLTIKTIKDLSKPKSAVVLFDPTQDVSNRKKL